MVRSFVNFEQPKAFIFPKRQLLKAFDCGNGILWKCVIVKEKKASASECESARRC